MGVVYKARQVSLNRIVAVKMILTGRLATSVEIDRFRAEARAAASLQHPNIVPIYEVGDQEGQNYFSMEFVDGPNLAHMVRENPLSALCAARYVQTIAEAIHFAHNHGVLHRDLKPSNILIDPFDQPRVTDFGLAKKLAGDAELTLPGQVLGAPSFVPPEQAAGRNKDMGPPSDVYGLGAILYYLLTGRPPFVAETLTATLAQVINNEPAAARSLNSNIPRDLETICSKCLEKKPLRRYGSAKELAEELGRFLRGEPILARPVMRAEKVWRWCGRNPALAGALGMVVLMLVAGIVGSTWEALRAEKAERQETRQRKRAEDSLAQLEVQHAEDLFAADNTARAVAQLAAVLNRDPSNRIAADRLLSALTSRNLCLPLSQLIGTNELGAIELADLSPDWLRMVTVATNTAQVWDVRTGKPLTKPFLLQENVKWARFSQVGSRVLTVSANSVMAWNGTTGEPLMEPIRDGHQIESAEISPDGLRVLTLSSNTVRVWDLLNGKPLTQPLQNEQELQARQFSREHSHFSPDGQRVITVAGHTAQVWDAQTGKPLTEPFRHEGDVCSAQFSPDGLRVLTASTNYARIWDVSTGKPLTEPLRHAADVADAEFSPDGLRIVTASLDSTARVWDALTGKPMTKPLAHMNVVSSAQFSQDGLRVLTLSHFENTARVWDSQTGRLLNELHAATFEDMDLCRFSPDGIRVLVPYFGTFWVWDVGSGRAFSETLIHEDVVNSALFSSDGLRIVAVSTNSARLWDAQTGKPLTDPLRHEATVNPAQFSPDGLRMLLISAKIVSVWDAQTGRPLSEPLRHGDDVKSAEFSPDGLQIVTASIDRTARVWDAQTGKPLTEPLRHEGIVNSSHFSPDGLRVVTVSANIAHLWNARTGKPITGPLRHDDVVNSAQFSPDGLRLLTAATNTVQVWDARTGKPITGPLHHDDVVDSAGFSPDGLRLLTVSANTARVWDAQTGKALTRTRCVTTQTSPLPSSAPMGSGCCSQSKEMTAVEGGWAHRRGYGIPRAASRPRNYCALNGASLLPDSPRMGYA